VKAFQAAQLETELRHLAFSILRRLCGRIGHLPKSYLLPDKFDLSGSPHVSGGVADIRMRVFKGKHVAVKTVKLSLLGRDIAKIRKVGNQATPSHRGPLIYPTAFL
jgi:hypothetical protein